MWFVFSQQIWCIQRAETVGMYFLATFRKTAPVFGFLPEKISGQEISRRTCYANKVIKATFFGSSVGNK